MGRFILLDEMLDNDHWLIPVDLVRYDRRYSPWPNELFPYNLTVSGYAIQNGYNSIKMRRFCEQQCRGDIAVDKVYTNSGYRLVWQFWFELEYDYTLFDNAWKPYIMEAT